MFWKDAPRLRSLTLASGLSIKDLELAFHGSTRTALEGAIDGSMRGQFSSDANHSEVKEWVEAGGNEVLFGPIQEIFATDCIECHSSETVAAGNLELDSYEGVEHLFEADTGKSISRLIALSHAHLLSVSVIVFFSILVIIGGALLGTAFGVLSLLGLWDLWFGKAE